MAISRSRDDLERDKFVESTEVANQASVSVVNPDGTFISEVQYQERTAVFNSVRTFYGRALDVNAGTDEAVWQIWVVDTVGSTGLNPTTHKQFALLSGVQNSGFVHIWDDRESLFPTVPYSNDLAISFDGTNDYIVVPDNAALDFTTSMSITFWVKGSGQNYSAMIAKMDSSGPDYSWYIGTDVGAGNDKLSIELHNQADGSVKKGYRGSLVILDNSWHHVAITWSSSTLNMYVDAVLDTSVNKYSDPAFSTINSSVADILIGASYSNSPSGFFNGIIDEIGLWNVGLSALEVAEVYNVGTPDLLTNHSAASGLVAYYRGDDDLYPTVSDKASSTHDGTMTNMTSTDFVTDAP